MIELILEVTGLYSVEESDKLIDVCNSLEFHDLIYEIEQKYNCRIDPDLAYNFYRGTIRELIDWGNKQRDVCGP